MKFEILFFGTVGFFIYDIYHDGKYTNIAMSYKKYYQMIGIFLLAYLVYYALTRKPEKCIEFLKMANEYVKYTKVDKYAQLVPTTSIMSGLYPNIQPRVNPINTINRGGFGSMNSIRASMGIDPTDGGGGGSSSANGKRSVSGIKKKVVAATQGWKCAQCNTMLNAWFEVDHRIRIDQGGSNETDNLMALCRECHGQKTTIESM